jgi:pyruvate formate lyase activating enzyme
MTAEVTGLIFNIQRFSVHDGPGIRTTVFLKGCPLRCHWCSNAESMSPKPELGFIRSRCNNCGKCVTACPEGAISLDSDNVIQFDRDRCTACAECVAVCASEALTIYGQQFTVEAAFREASRDRIFYEDSGGVTVSGGEPLQQADFVKALFRRCRQAGIGTCLDTSGHVPTEKLKEVLALTDYVLYDIKHMDSGRHRHFTGQPNELILANAEVVAASGVAMLCRIPLIAGVNDSAANITDTGRFIRKLRDDIAVEFLPYHRLGVGKYRTLDRPYPGEDLAAPDTGHIESLKQILNELGVKCTVSS